MTAALPDYTCKCGKRWVAKPAPDGALMWASVDATVPPCPTCSAKPAPERGAKRGQRSGLSVVGRMRDRENAQREARGEAPMVDVPLGEAVRRVGSIVSKALGIGPKPPKQPDALEAHGEPVEDDETSGGAHRRVVSGK